MSKTGFALAVALILPGAVPASAGTVAPAIVIEGASKEAVSFTAEDLKTLPRRSVEATDHDGQKSSFEGWMLGEVLAKAGMVHGKELRGPALATVVIATAADGYRVAFAIAELDAGMTDKVVLLADRRDGKPLAASEGPFRVVAPDEKRPARWIRQVTTFAVEGGKP